MSKSTWGTIRKLGTDTWQITYHAGDDLKTERFHGTRSEAEHRLADLRRPHEGRTEPLAITRFWKNR